MSSSIPYFFVHPATIVYPAQIPSGYGTATVSDYDTGTRVPVRGWFHQLSQTEQQTATRDAVVSTHSYILPAGTPIGPDDRIEIDGETFEVEGLPARPWSPNGEEYVRAFLTRVDG